MMVAKREEAAKEFVDAVWRVIWNDFMADCVKIVIEIEIGLIWERRKMEDCPVLRFEGW